MVSTTLPTTKMDRHYHENCRAAYQLAWQLTGNREDAQDLTQQAFIRAFAAFDRFDARRPFRPWILRIVWNCQVDNLRRRTVRGGTILSLDQPLMTSASGEPCHLELADKGSVFTHVFGNTFSERMQKALDQVPSDFRAVLLLCDAKDYSYQETADIIGISIHIVRSRLHRGRKIFRQAYLSLDDPG